MEREVMSKHGITERIKGLTGSCFRGQGKGYDSKISIKGTTYFLGNYALGADSGLAFDKCILPLLDANFSRWVSRLRLDPNVKAVRLTTPPSALNFETIEDFEYLRAAEIEATGINVDLDSVLETMTNKVSEQRPYSRSCLCISFACLPRKVSTAVKKIRKSPAPGAATKVSKKKTSKKSKAIKGTGSTSSGASAPTPKAPPKSPNEKPAAPRASPNRCPTCGSRIRGRFPSCRLGSKISRPHTKATMQPRAVSSR